jgi:hypothetical protein
MEDLSSHPFTFVFLRLNLPVYDYMLHDVFSRSGCDTVKPSHQMVRSRPLALDQHRRQVPYIICAMLLRHSYDPMNVSHCHALASRWISPYGRAQPLFADAPMAIRDQE